MSESLSPATVTEAIVTTPAHVAKVESPVVETAPAAEIVTPAPAEAAPVETPAVPATEAPAEAPAKTDPKLHTDTKTLLEETANVADKAAEDGAKPEQPEAKKPEGEAKPEEAKPAEVQPPQPEAPVVYEMKLPDGFGTVDEQLNSYTEILREHRISPEIGQQLLDMHAAHVQQLAENTLAAQHEAFATMRAEWRDQIKNDPMLGGAGFETTKRAVARARDLLVPESDRAAFNEFLTTTGAGDHPAFWRALYRAANLYDEPVAPAPTARPTPNANPTPRRGVMGLFDKKANNSFTTR